MKTLSILFLTLTGLATATLPARASAQAPDPRREAETCQTWEVKFNRHLVGPSEQHWVIRHILDEGSEFGFQVESPNPSLVNVSYFAHDNVNVSPSDSYRERYISLIAQFLSAYDGHRGIEFKCNMYYPE